MWPTRLERLTEQLNDERQRIAQERQTMRNAARAWSAWRSLAEIKPRPSKAAIIGAAHAALGTMADVAERPNQNPAQFKAPEPDVMAPPHPSRRVGQACSCAWGVAADARYSAGRDRHRRSYLGHRQEWLRLKRLQRGARGNDRSHCKCAIRGAT